MTDLKGKLLSSYDYSCDNNGISGERVADRLCQLSVVGMTEKRGSNRPGYSKEEKNAKELVKGWMKEAGLVVKEDEAGNVFGRLGTQNGPAVLTGSHVDTVPEGGHFDGTLGVIAALEVASSWKEQGYLPPFPFEVVVFSDEEGSRFGRGFTGSEAVIGELNKDHLAQLKDHAGKSFEEVMQHVDLSLQTIDKAKREDIYAFLEVHIEQGKQLERANYPVGVVTGIAGPSWIELRFIGEAAHAGNTPMNDRQDALVAASALIHELPNMTNGTAVATVGKLDVFPNGVNVIPEEVKLYVDVRDIDEENRNKLVDSIIEKARHLADKQNVLLKQTVKTKVKPVPVDPKLKQILINSLKEMNSEALELPSGAAHDAMIIGRRFPVAMLFARSKNGVSHNPEEWTTLNDCVTAIHVLKNSLEQLPYHPKQ
ncbi:Zn-dependent hydrolase [Halobacillus andaensis]|uniref:Zn-dependent hydrolase n=1 Tax=Halobacillus andaensis TaxID=1176239 RepID=A0A917AYE3_HALAA|nr:Zn-dependent hydrolase [Halobacillus andaensis]MBP2002977.1 allantoate deiminase [Halobacillus andaensis]GGF07092.1 Zn-dependent hydrolase [Halobacillus andaensis]